MTPLIRTFGSPTALTAKIAAAYPRAEIVPDADGRRGHVAALVWSDPAGEIVGFAAENESLRWIHLRSAGIPLDLPGTLRGRSVMLTNGVGTHGAAIAEHVVALLLAHYKRLGSVFAAQRDRRWAVPPGMDELRGKTAGIIGLGDLGRSTARLLTPFGVTVRGLRRSGVPVDEVSATYGPERLAEFLDALDVLIIAAPLTRDTVGMIGSPQLALLRPGAVVVNVGRGPVVNEDALVSAVRGGHIGGALLDVFATEPLPESSPLWSLPGVLITAHCADATEQTDRRCSDLLLDNLRRFRDGRPLRNVVALDEPPATFPPASAESPGM